MLQEEAPCCKMTGNLCHGNVYASSVKAIVDNAVQQVATETGYSNKMSPKLKRVTAVCHQVSRL